MCEKAVWLQHGVTPFVPAVAGTEEIVKTVSGSAEVAGSDSVSLA